MKRFAVSCLLVLSVAIIFPQPGHSQQKSAAKETLKKDYSKELPRIPATEPANAVKTFKLQPGFKIELVAAEPLLRDPVAVDFDERGRLYVCEMPEYNMYADPSVKAQGAVKLLEDTDGDGTFDKSTVFLDKVNSPGAVFCYDGGVFVGSVPDILYCKDTNGDGKADVRKSVFTGFARDHAGEAMLNSFRWGFDNRIHLSTNLAGGNVKRTDSEDKPVSVRGQGFIFDPKTLEFELTSGGGQHGMSMDNWGRKFVCSNSNPAQTLMYDGRYISRNPYFAAPEAAVNITVGKYVKIFRISKNEPWRVLRTRLRSQGLVKGSDEGGKPSGFFTGATGVTIYRGDAWPKSHRGNLLVGEVASNMIYRANIVEAGIQLKSVRANADSQTEFLASTDNWFRPVQMAHGPDGAIYVVDMYRELIEGAAFLAPEILQHMHVASGVNRGRIYRIVPTNFKRPQIPDFHKLNAAGLVQLLDSENGWTRDTASRLLYERQDQSAVGPLRQLAANSKSSLTITYALNSLNGLQMLDESLVLSALNSKDEKLKIQALKLAEGFAEKSVAIRKKMEQMTDDESLQVRYQLAFSLGAYHSLSRNKALVKVLTYDASNSWVQMAVFSSLNSGSGNVFELLADDEKFRASKSGSSFLTKLATQIGAANRSAEIATVINTINGLAEKDKSLSQLVLRGLLSKQTGKNREKLAAAGGEKSADLLKDLITSAQKTAIDTKAKPGDRAEAIRTLGLASFADNQKSFTKFLDLQQPQPVQSAALETLGRYSQPEVADLLISTWPQLSPSLRAKAAETLFSRAAWIQKFLTALEQKKVSQGEIDPARIQLLKLYPDEKVRTRAAKLFASRGLNKRADVVKQYQPTLQLTGDVAKGKAIFKKVCSACHKLEGVGTTVGADLKAIKDRGLSAVLLNLLDPNREVKPQYLSYVLVTTEGLAHTGMIISETANSLTLRRPDGTNITVLRIDIEALKSTGLSFMPEGLEKQVNVKSMADLLAYLNSIQ